MSCMSRSTRFALGIWPIVLGASLVIGANRFEHRYMPVMEDFVVTSMSSDGKNLIMEGYLNKTRNCTFSGLAVTGNKESDPVDLPIKFMDSPYRQENRPTGTQEWGPWQIVIPLAPELKTISMSAHHKCHPFWATETHLVDLPLKDMIDAGMIEPGNTKG